VNRAELDFARPSSTDATAPPEARGQRRDEIRLMVTGPEGTRHARFLDLAEFLDPGDLLVVNRSATLAASLPANANSGPFRLHLSTDFGGGLWLAEPRRDTTVPGPIPLEAGERFEVAGLSATAIRPYPGLPRLWFVRLEGDVRYAMETSGSPIRYGYLDAPVPLAQYQTLFAEVPGSAEMPSAGRPFTPRVLERLRARGVTWAGIVLHTGVSSLEVESDRIEAQPLVPEPFWVGPETARTVNDAHRAGRRVVAVGTTVVRALESAWTGCEVSPSAGFTRRFVHPGTGIRAVDGLLTGLHDRFTSHLALLFAFLEPDRVRAAYGEAARNGYLWHEFGDSHLLLRH
jgi:S-adenosylmethionine:tRNA ribosyltransferase-isomerase